jgi:molybdopterin/thiamine biosynthesis adenylyltransferase
MTISTNLWSDDFPEFLLTPDEAVRTFHAPSLPPPHPAEPDTFARHEGIPGHDQETLASARIVLVGAGGLNSWTALGLVRSGAQSITILDHDLADRTNMPRQLYFADDLGQPKAIRLTRNLIGHAVAGAQLTGISLPFELTVKDYALPADLLVVGVDNNLCRLHCVREARARRIPAVFTMLSRDGMRCQSFLQAPNPEDACLWCALPNLDPESAAPCAAAIISSCFLASAFAIFFVHRALMGWPEEVEPYNWHEADLLGVTPARVGMVARRLDCPACGSFGEG